MLEPSHAPWLPTFPNGPHEIRRLGPCQLGNLLANEMPKSVLEPFHCSMDFDHLGKVWMNHDDFFLPSKYTNTQYIPMKFPLPPFVLISIIPNYPDVEFRPKTQVNYTQLFTKWPNIPIVNGLFFYRNTYRKTPWWMGQSMNSKIFPSANPFMWSKPSPDPLAVAIDPADPVKRLKQNIESKIHLHTATRNVSLHLSICISICISICLSIYLSIYLSLYLSLSLSIYLSIYLSLYVHI